MKVKIGHEELWVVCLDGSGLPGEPVTVDLPEGFVDRCKAAEAEWWACHEILEAAMNAYEERKAARKSMTPKQKARTEPWVD